jgi:hypothetical protein
LASLVYLLIALLCFRKIFKKIEEKEDGLDRKEDFWRKNCEKIEFIPTDKEKRREINQ